MLSISLRGNATTSLVNDLHLIMSMKLIELRARNAKVIIAPTYGIDLAVYAKSHTNAELVIHSDQPHLEDCIWRMNCMFIQFNKETSMPTPWVLSNNAK